MYVKLLPIWNSVMKKGTVINYVCCKTGFSWVVTLCYGRLVWKQEMTAQCLKTDIMKSFPPIQKTQKGRFETFKITKKKMWYSSDLALLQGCRDRKESMFIEYISIQNKPQTMWTRQAMYIYNVRLSCVHATTLAVEKQKVRVCSLSYPACNVHAPYC